MDELGIARRVSAAAASESRPAVGLRRRRARHDSPTSRICRRSCKFIALMPQWDFLDFLAAEARALSGLPPDACGTEADGLIEEGGRVVGVSARSAWTGDARQISTPISSSAATAGIRRCESVRGSPSRTSARRWMCCGSACRASPTDTDETGRPLRCRQLFVMLNRGDYWQCAFVIAKGGFEQVQAARARRLPRRGSARSLPFDAATRSRDHRSGIDVKLLTVAVDRLQQWHRPGLLVHRRRRARHVADRRRRHQSRDPGRRGGGKYFRRPTP